MMTDYADRLRKFNRAGQVQYVWLYDVADYIEDLEIKLGVLEYNRVAAWNDGYEAGKNAILKVDGELYKNLKEEIAELRHRLGDFDEDE